MPRMTHPDVAADPVDVTPEAFELVWSDLGWVLVDDEPDELVVALAGHEAAGIDAPETFEVTAADVQAAADEAAIANGEPAPTDDQDPDHSDTPSDPPNEPDTGQED